MDPHPPYGSFSSPFLVSPPPTPEKHGYAWNESVTDSSCLYNSDKSTVHPVSVSQTGGSGGENPPVDPLAGMMRRVNNLHEDLNRFDRGINFASVMPIAGVICTIVKVLAGIVQVIAAGFFKLITAIGIAIAKKNGDIEGMKKWQFLSELAELHCKQASCRIVGGISQTLIGAATCGVGNLLFVIPNAQEGKDWFAARTQYPTPA